MDKLKLRFFIYGTVLFGLFALIAVLATPLQTVAQSASSLIRFYDFEDGVIPGSETKVQSCWRAEVKPVILSESTGNRFLHITASPDDHFSVPAGSETVRSLCSLGGSGSITSSNQVRTYYISVKFSGDSPQTTTVMQLFQYGSGGGYAVADDQGPALRLYRRDGNLLIFNEYDHNRQQQDLSLGRIGINKFAHITITVHWTIDPSKGRVDVWVDGKSAGSLTGKPTSLGETSGVPEMHIGSYGGNGVGSIDFDNVGYKNGTASGEFPVSSSNFCHLLDSFRSVPQGFGASYNILSSAKELLLKALCGESSVEYPVGNGSGLQYIYNQGYYWVPTPEGSGQAGSWQTFSYTCQGQTVGSWCIGNATYTRSLTSTQLSQTNYYVAYVCNWTGSAWKCGCRDSSCTQNFWNLQAFKKQ